jgi:hypothetical protein
MFCYKDSWYNSTYYLEPQCTTLKHATNILDTTYEYEQGCYIGRLEEIGCPKWMKQTNGHVHLSFKRQTYWTYSLDILWKYLKYAWIYLNISLSDKREAYRMDKTDGWPRQTSRHMNNHEISRMLILVILHKIEI